MLFACGSDSKNDQAVNADDLMAEDAEGLKAVKEKTENIFYSVPSPIETAMIIKNAGASYNKDYLNPIENLSKYSTLKSQALNLGVYGTDLSFTSIFDEAQESMLYLRCANSLASDLGVANAFGESTVSRIEANMDNQDSLLHIISNAYWEADSYLKENERGGISSLIIAGGWIEGLYIASIIAESTKNEEIVRRLGEQKLALTNLIGLLEASNGDNNATDLISDLKSLEEIYSGVTFTQGETSVSTDNKSGVTTIGSSSKITATPEQIKAIIAKSREIRSKIIQ